MGAVDLGAVDLGVVDVAAGFAAEAALADDARADVAGPVPADLPAGVVRARLVRAVVFAGAAAAAGVVLFAIVVRTSSRFGHP